MKMTLSPIFKHMIHTGMPYEAGHMLWGLFAECEVTRVEKPCALRSLCTLGSEHQHFLWVRRHSGLKRKSFHLHGGHTELTAPTTSCALESGAQGGSAVRSQVQGRRQGSEPTWSEQNVSAPLCLLERKKVQSFGHVQLFVTPWTAAYQAPSSMGFFHARGLEWVAISFSRGSS